MYNYTGRAAARGVITGARWAAANDAKIPWQPRSPALLQTASFRRPDFGSTMEQYPVTGPSESEFAGPMKC